MVTAHSYQMTGRHIPEKLHLKTWPVPQDHVPGDKTVSSFSRYTQAAQRRSSIPNRELANGADTENSSDNVSQTIKLSVA